jgi:hypothetical protein
MGSAVRYDGADRRLPETNITALNESIVKSVYCTDVRRVVRRYSAPLRQSRQQWGVFMVNDIFIQVLAGVAVSVITSTWVLLRRRAQGLPRPSPVVAAGLAAMVMGLAAVTAYLVGVLVVAPQGGAGSGSPKPVVVRIEGPGIERRRGFVTAQGYLIAPAHGMPVGQEASVSWPNGGGTATAPAEVLRVGGCERAVAVLEIEDPPDSAHAFADAGGLQPGDAVSRLVPKEPVAGTVVALRVANGGGCTWLVTTRLNNSSMTHPGDAGAPVLDANGRTVAMIAMNDPGQGHTLSLPIEHIREAFPWAFEAPSQRGAL